MTSSCLRFEIYSSSPLRDVEDVLQTSQTEATLSDYGDQTCHHDDHLDSVCPDDSFHTTLWIESVWYPDSKVHGANMGPTWGRQDPGGPHVDPMNFAIWVLYKRCNIWRIYDIRISAPKLTPIWRHLTSILFRCYWRAECYVWNLDSATKPAIS